MWFTPLTFAIAIAVIILAVAIPATYALYLARRLLAANRKRRTLEGRTLAWHYLALTAAYLAGGAIAVTTWGMVNLIVIPAGIADLSINAYNRRIDRRIRSEMGIPDDVEQTVLPRAIVRRQGA
ncbi:MAG TPA: hypothetical protein VGM90_02735 [Kofleriaceae bacterium]|jgi:hypothetical protein